MKKVFFTTFISLMTAYSSQLFAQPKAIIKNSSTKYLILGKDKAEITKEYEVIINNENGLDYSRFVDYHDKFKKIQQLEVIVLDKNNEKVKRLGKSDAIDIKFDKSYEIDDSRILVLFPDYKEYPFTVKISTKSIYNGFISLPTWIPRFDYDLRVESAYLEIKYPADYKINFFEEHMVRATTKQNNGSETIKWELSNLEAIGKNVNRTTFYNSQPKVLVAPLEFELDGVKGSFETWENFGNWFIQLNKGRDKLLHETKKYLDSLKSTDNKNLVSKVYHYMQDKTRYVSIQLGIGGFQTIPSEVVEKTGYGDCKALTNYVKAMLDYVEIPSNYILVKAGANASDVNADFPSNQFNHVFLGVPSKKDTIFLECTSQMLPTNYIGKFTDDRNVLWVQENHSKIIRSRKYKEDENIKVTKGKISIDENGNAQILAKTSNKGVFYDDFMRYRHVSNEDAKQYHYGKFPYRDFTIKKLEYSRAHRDSVNFELDFSLSINNLAKKSSEKMLIPLNMWLSIESDLDIETVSSSAEIKRGFRIYDEFEVDIPNSYWQKKPIKDRAIDSEFGSYNISIVHDDKKYLIKREIVIKKGFYEGDEFELFNGFLKKIKRTDKTKIVLDSKT